MKKIPLRIVSRKSPLALWQAEFVKAQLLQHHPNLDITILGISTEGDGLLNIPLTKIGGKGLFVKELEEHLLSFQADIAVHSLKDMPSQLPLGLEIAAILKREDPRDAFVSTQFADIKDLPANARVGSSSLRRQSQFLALHPESRIEMLRGNVDTRVQKLDRGEFDAILLAVAGLKRLGLEHRITETFSPDVMLPAIGQGALGIECRMDDEVSKNLIASLNDYSTSQCVSAERQMNALLDGGCQLPVAGLATLSAGILTLTGLVASPDGQVILKSTAFGDLENPLSLGQSVAENLLAKGAQKILDACKIDRH